MVQKQQEKSIEEIQEVTRLTLFNLGLTPVLEYVLTHEEMALLSDVVAPITENDKHKELKIAIQDKHRVLLHNLNILIVSENYNDMQMYINSRFNSFSVLKEEVEAKYEVTLLGNIKEEPVYYEHKKYNRKKRHLSELEKELYIETTRTKKETGGIMLNYYGYTFATTKTDITELETYINKLDTLLKIPQELKERNIRLNSVYEIEHKDFEPKYTSDNNELLRKKIDLLTAFQQGVHETYLGVQNKENLLKIRDELSQQQVYLLILETVGDFYTVVLTRNEHTYKNCLSSIEKNNIQEVMDELFYSVVGRNPILLKHHKEVEQYLSIFGTYPDSVYTLNLFGFEFNLYSNMFSDFLMDSVIKKHQNDINILTNGVYFYKPNDKVYIDTSLKKPTYINW